MRPTPLDRLLEALAAERPGRVADAVAACLADWSALVALRDLPDVLDQVDATSAARKAILPKLADALRAATAPLPALEQLLALGCPDRHDGPWAAAAVEATTSRHPGLRALLLTLADDCSATQCSRCRSDAVVVGAWAAKLDPPHRRYGRAVPRGDRVTVAVPMPELLADRLDALATSWSARDGRRWTRAAVARALLWEAVDGTARTS